MLMPLPIQAGLTCCAASLCIVVLYPVYQGSALLSLNSAINHIADSRITKRTVEMCQLPTSGKTRAFTDFDLFNHLIRAGAAVAGYADPEVADFPVKLAPG